MALYSCLAHVSGQLEYFIIQIDQLTINLSQLLWFLLNFGMILGHRTLVGPVFLAN
jgi:hypothetical protein